MPYRITILLFLAATLSAYEGGQPLGKIPPHLSYWEAAPEPNQDTLILWNFDPEQEMNEDEIDALLTEDRKEDALDGLNREIRPGSSGAKPILRGGVRELETGGFFGGAAELDGSGQLTAEGVDLRDKLESDGGVSIDLWVKPTRTLKPGASECILTIPLKGGTAEFSLLRRADNQLALLYLGKEELVHQGPVSADTWSHIELVLIGHKAAEGANIRTSLHLGVNGNRTELEMPEWLNDRGRPRAEWGQTYFTRSVDSTLHFGNGARESSGFVGLFDAIRILRRKHYFYPWALGRQILTGREESGIGAPFFREGRVLTRFRFDGDLEPELFTGFGRSGKAGKEQFTTGLRGQALDLSRIDQSKFFLQGYSALPDNGTVEFWFRPKDWDNFYLGSWEGAEVKKQQLLALINTKGPVKGFPTKVMSLWQGRPCSTGKAKWERFTPGTWTHVLIAITNRNPATYLNGERQKQQQVGLASLYHIFSRQNHEEWEKRTGGKEDGSYRLDFIPSPTLLDELSIYSWTMNAEEAWNAYARWLPEANLAMKPLPAFRTDFAYQAQNWEGKERLVVNLTALPVNGVKPATMDFTLRDAAGTSLHEAKGLAVDEKGDVKVVLERAFDFGTYPVEIRSRGADGSLLKEIKIDYVRERPAWFENTLGEERTVPAPWTPITVTEKEITVLNRSVKLTAGGLVEAIHTQQQPLLTSPITMKATTPQGTEVLTGTSVRFTETEKDLVAWSGSLNGAGVNATVDAWMEFDGLLYTTVTLTPTDGKSIEVSQLEVDIPLQVPVARQFIANGGGPNFRAGCQYFMIPEASDWTWSSAKKSKNFSMGVRSGNFMPQIWLGNDEVGLNICGENDKGWTVDETLPAQEVIRRGNSVVYRMNVICKPVTVEGSGHSFHFILLPTPAKPEPETWREEVYNLGDWFAAVDSFGGLEMKGDPEDPQEGDTFRLEPVSWEIAAQQSQALRKKMGECLLYTDASWPRPGPAFKDWNHALNAGTGRTAWTPEFEDYFVWAMNEFLKKGLIDGIYIDDVSVGRTLSLQSTAYAFPGSEDGRRVGFTFMAQRRALKRLYRLFEARKMTPKIWLHMTLAYEIPMFSFSRYLLNGEIFSGIQAFKPRDAMDCWSPEALRVLGGAPKWGSGMPFKYIVEFKMENQTLYEQAVYPHHRAQTGVFSTSDAGFQNATPIMQLGRKGLFEPGVTATPWWRVEPLLTLKAPEGANVHAAVYAWKKKAFVFLSNHDREEREVSVTLKPGALFPASSQVRWTDQDPNLTPPASTVASAKEIKSVQAEAGDAFLDGEKMEESQIEDILEDTDPEQRAKGNLMLRITGEAATVLIRPRDFRVLEVQPNTRSGE